MASADRQIEPGSISMVTHDGDPIFVRWKRVSDGRTGRQISLDKFGRIISIVAYMVPELDLSEATIHIRDTAAVMLKTPMGGRPHMPQWCILIWRRLQYQQYAGPRHQEDADSDIQCVYCKHAVPVGQPPEHDEDDDGLYACAACLTHWHHSCVRLVGDRDAVVAAPFICPICAEAEQWE